MSGISDGNSSFWSKPEGKFGAVVGLGLTGLFGFGLYKVLPYLVSIAHNMFVLGAYAAVIAGMFYVLVLDSSLRNMLVNFYKRLIRAMYILSFNLDPIGGLKERMKEKRKELVTAREQASEIKGQSEAVRKTNEENASFIEDGLKRMAHAQKQGDPARAMAESVRVGVAKEAVKQLTALQDRIDRAYAMTAEIIHKAELGLYVLDGVITVKERTYKTAKAGRSALKTALGVLLGNTEKDAIFDDNIAWIDDYTASAFGEMDAALDLSKDALNSIDLQQGVYSEDAFALLEQRLAASNEKLANDPRGQKLLQASADPSMFGSVMSSPEAVPVRVGSSTSGADFGHLFDSKK